MGTLSQLSADAAQAERLKPMRRLTDQEQFLLDTAFLPLSGLAAMSNKIMDAMMCEPDEAKRGELSRCLLVIDHIADLKFPGEFTSARRRAA
jgi:hypothetical protein